MPETAEPSSETAEPGGGGGLGGRVVDLARDLRSLGVEVSAAEILDAVLALPALPLERREVVREALAATLLKSPVHRRTFDRVFEAHFPIRPLIDPDAESGPTAGEHAFGIADDTERELSEALLEGDEDRLRDLARRMVRERGDVDADANLSEDAFIFRAMRGLNLDAIKHRLRDDSIEGEGKNVLQRKIIEEDLTERMEEFRRMLHDQVFSEMMNRLSLEEMTDRERRPPPDEVDFLWAQDTDLEVMREALRPLARRLTRQLSRRRRQGRRGRLDVRRTIRRSLSTGGVFLEPAFRRPTAGKPELVLLCDISGSMRAFARFTLELTYALSTEFQQVRTFVFVDATDEVTAMLDAASDMPAVLDRIDTEADVVHFDGQSWYGNSLAQFWKQAGPDLNSKTTVVVLGDARNNFRTTGVESLRKVRERARAVHWLNPEPASHWDTGDSVMATYTPACDAVFEVRNLRQLESYVSRAV